MGQRTRAQNDSRSLNTGKQVKKMKHQNENHENHHSHLFEVTGSDINIFEALKR